MRFIIELRSRTGEAGNMGTDRLIVGPFKDRELARRWAQRNSEVLQYIDWQERRLPLIEPDDAVEKLAKAAGSVSKGKDIY